MKKKKLQGRKPQLPFLLCLIRGAIGKQFVIKHYSYGAIKTKYPDMSRIVASAKQNKRRDLFKEAVAYAQQVIADPIAKAAWQKKLRKRNSVYNEAVKFYMLKARRDRQAAEILAARMIRWAFKNEGAEDADVMCSTRISKSKQVPEVNYDSHNVCGFASFCKADPEL